MSIPELSVLQIELTKNCNNRCIMCHKGQYEGFDKSDISDIALRQMKVAYPGLKRAILFGDGEPMLFRRFWDVVRDIRQASPDCAIEFINNGSMMGPTNIERVLQYEISGLGLSMGGASPATHNHIRKLSSFERVVSNYRALQKAKESKGSKEPYVHGLIIAMKSNYKEIPKFVALCAWMGLIRVEVQQLFVTHPSMNDELISDTEVEPYFSAARQIADKCGVQFTHYPLKSGKDYSRRFMDGGLFNPNDRYFRCNPRPWANSGYCLYGQPWHTTYVLHDGSVVPDCHWWSSKNMPHFNTCGTLDENTNLLDIWGGEKYQQIRGLIQSGAILPQCRGCGLAGGVKPEFRCAATDHTNPDESLVQVTVRGVEQEPTTPFYLQWLSENGPVTAESIRREHVRRIQSFNPSFDYPAFLKNIETAYQERQSLELVLKSKPIYIDLEPYNLCNYKCITCQSMPLPRGQMLSDETISYMLSLVPTAEHVEYAKIGEIFMLPARILPIMRETRRRNPCIFMRTNTNGQTLTEEVMQTLVNIEFDLLSVSIDSHDPEGFKSFTQTGDLEKVLRNMMRLREIKRQRGAKYPIVCVCCQLQKYADPLSIAKISHQIGAEAVIFQDVAVYPQNESKFGISEIKAPGCYGGVEQMNKLICECADFCKMHRIGLEYPKAEGLENRCMFFDHVQPLLSCNRSDGTCPTGDPWYRLCVNGRGGISPCCFHSTFCGVAGSDAYPLDRQVPLSDIWNHKAMVGLRKMLRDGHYSPGCFCWKRFLITSGLQSETGDLYKLFCDYSGLK